jgi:hypothetical protein
MKDFKLDDEVRVLEMADGGDVPVGTVDVITDVLSNGEVRVGSSSCNWCLGGNGGKLELVKPELVKPETVIKVGDTVERIDGSEYQGKLQNVVTSLSLYGLFLRINDKCSGDYIYKYKIVRTYPNAPHIHQKEIKAWADGADIQWFGKSSKVWYPHNGDPKWHLNIIYRVKPDVDPRLEELNATLADLNKSVAFVKKESGEL